MLSRSLTVLLLLAASGCRGTESLAWRIEATESVRDKARLVTAQVRAGGCDGSAVFRSTAPPDQGMPSPDTLAPGRYGFAIEVSNDACETFARGCTEVELPASTVTTTLQPIVPERHCAADQCTNGICEADFDASVDGKAEGGTADTGLPDANRPDAIVDGGTDGGLPLAPGCSTGVDEWTALLFGFEDLPGMTSLDNTGTFTASFFTEGSPSTPTTASQGASASGCGKGFLGDETWGNVDHDPVFARREASLDLLYKTPTSYIPTRMIAILSKDAAGAQASHINLGINPDGRIMLRVQPDGSEFYRCSEPIPNATWIHIGINFGDPDLELWVNGKLARASGEYGYLGTISPVPCETATRAVGLDDNTEPWAIGASAHLSTAGTNDMVIFEHDFDAVIDRFRFSTTRRDFSDPPLPPQ